MKRALLLPLSTERRSIGLACLGLIGLCFLAFFNQLGTLGLMDKTEGLFAEVPRQMLLQGDWVTPRWNGQTFFDYPVWGYWMVALSFQLFGVTEWAARLPAALAASLTVLALFGVVLKLGSDSEPIRQRLGRATLAGSLLALSPGWIAWGRSSVTDMFLASAITLALLGFLLVYQAGFTNPSQQSRNQQRLGYGCLSLFSAIAVLAKGPVGLLLPGLVIIVFLVLKGELLTHIRKAPWLPMAALFLGVTLPWYCQATIANGFDFISRFIGYSNFQRFTSVIYSHPGPPWFYIPWVFVFMLPWSLYLPVAVMRLRFWRLATWRQSSIALNPSLFGLAWLVCMVAFYSAAATKLAGYILPVVPAGVLIVSLLFQPISSQRPIGAGYRVSGWFNVVVITLAAIATAVFPQFLRQDPDYPFFSTALIHSGVQVWLPFVFVLTVLWLVWILLRPHALPLVWLPNATALSVVLALAVPSILPLVDRARLEPIRRLGAVAGELVQQGDVLVIVGFKRYSLLYYSNHSALFVTTPDELFAALPNRKAVKNLFLFGTDRELRRFGLNPSDCRSSRCQVVARRDAHVLIRTSPEDLPKSS